MNKSKYKYFIEFRYSMPDGEKMPEPGHPEPVKESLLGTTIREVARPPCDMGAISLLEKEIEQGMPKGAFNVVIVGLDLLFDPSDRQESEIWTSYNMVKTENEFMKGSLNDKRELVLLQRTRIRELEHSLAVALDVEKKIKSEGITLPKSEYHELRNSAAELEIRLSGEETKSRQVNQELADVLNLLREIVDFDFDVKKNASLIEGRVKTVVSKECVSLMDVDSTVIVI